jgi:ATP-binding cassette subfamily B (MDR/TAP) protein 11
MDEQREAIIFYTMFFIAVGVLSFFAFILQGSMFGISSENLTRRLRSLTFEKILSQDVAWFDSPANDIGTLSTRLALDTAAVHAATGVRVGTQLWCFSILGVGLIVAFAYSWIITVLIIGFLPFIFLSGLLQVKMQTGFSKKDLVVLEEAGRVSHS